MGLRPNKLISQDLTYGHSSTKPSFQVLRTLASAYSWARASCTKPNSPYSVDHLVSFSEHCTVTSGGRVGTGWLSPYWLLTLLIAGSRGYAYCPASRERIGPRINTSPGKDPCSKSQGGFLLNTYHFHTFIKSKTFKSSHPKSRTVCYYFPRSKKDVKAGSWDSVNVDLVLGCRGGFLSVYFIIMLQIL